MSHEVTILHLFFLYLSVFLVPEPLVDAFEVESDLTGQLFDLLPLPLTIILRFDEKLLHLSHLSRRLFLQFKAFSRGLSLLHH